MTQEKRNRKSRDVVVEELNEVREGVYVGDFRNENYEDRQYVLIPAKLFSSSPDMIYSSSDGYVGKYLLASAKEDSEFRDELLTAIRDRVNHLSELESQSEEEEALLEALDKISDNKLQVLIKERLDSLNTSGANTDKVMRRMKEAASEIGESV